MTPPVGADRLAPLRLLVVDARVPTPNRDGGSLRMVHLCQMLLARSVDVVLASSHPQSFPPFDTTLADDSARLTAMGVRLPSGGDDVEAHLARHGRDYDVVLMSGAFVASRHLSAVRRFAPQATLVFDTIDLHFLREFRAAKLTGNVPRLQHALALKRIELGLARAADVTVVVSEHEQELLRAEVPQASVLLLPNIHARVDASAPLAGRRELMFLGAFTHDPNADAMVWFVRHALPALRLAAPGLGLRIVGADPTPGVRALACDHVVVTGYVDNLAIEFDRARAFVAPLRFGAGIKGKLLLSLAHGLPVVASPVAAEGIPLVDGRDVLVARTIDDWVHAVTHLLADDAAWTAQSAAGREVVNGHYSFEAASRHVDALLARIRSRRADASEGFA